MVAWMTIMILGMAGLGVPAPLVTQSACITTLNGHSGLKVGTTWSGDRVSGGKYAVETNRAGAYGVHWELSWSLPKAARSGSHSHTFELYYNGANEQAQTVSLEVTSGGKVVWTGTIRQWEIKPCQ